MLVQNELIKIVHNNLSKAKKCFQVFALQGKQTEGIFRVSADVDEVTVLKARLDNWELPDHLHITG